MSAFNPTAELDVTVLLKQSWEIFVKDPINWILIGLVGALALGCGGWGGYQYCALKALRGEKVGVADVLYPFSNFHLIVPMLALIGISIVTCGLGAIVLGYLWMWMYPLMIRDGLTFGEAAKASKDAALGNVGATGTAFAVVIALAMVGGVVPFGGIVTTPLIVLFMMAALFSVFPVAGGLTPQQLDYAPGMPAPTGPSDFRAAPKQAAPVSAGGAWGAPPAAAPPAAAPPAAAPRAAAPPAAAPTVVESTQDGGALPAAADSPVETAQQSTTNNPDEVVAGKTIAMSAVDFESMLKNRDSEKGS